MGRIHMVGWTYAAFVGGFIGAFGLYIYPIIISPMMDPEPYKRVQKTTRAGVIQENIQPGNMKVWSDPFTRKPSETK